MHARYVALKKKKQLTSTAPPPAPWRAKPSSAPARSGRVTRSLKRATATAKRGEPAVGPASSWPTNVRGDAVLAAGVAAGGAGARRRREAVRACVECGV